MDEPDAVMTRIGKGIELSQRGARGVLGRRRCRSKSRRKLAGLRDDGYGRMIKSALDRLAARLPPA